MISVRLHLVGSSVLILVSDGDPRPPVRREPDSTATGGRGLLLTEAMAIRWGYYRPKARPGKIVWAEVGVQPTSDSLLEAGEPRPRDHTVGSMLLGRVLTGLDGWE
ncbi:hypothetical protein FHS42_001593 [Streptomyces zagrosensis]|uniref:ATP-binding protein n=2 Tax=Streptomyces zagrosensis TaxID=1042984 RepID=A0A7W9UXQ0_9ACTN|nr:hypothetical protein [Streptomyces zagrosensis]